MKKVLLTALMILTTFFQVGCKEEVKKIKGQSPKLPYGCIGTLVSDDNVIFPLCVEDHKTTIMVSNGDCLTVHLDNLEQVMLHNRGSGHGQSPITVIKKNGERTCVKDPGKRLASLIDVWAEAFP